MYYDKQEGKYQEGATTQILWYVNDQDYTQSVFIGWININLSQIVNQKRDPKGKVLTTELDIDLEKWDYGNTSVQVSISAKKNLRIAKNVQMEEIKQNSNRKKPEVRDGTFYMISNDDIDNFEEKYMSDDAEDEFFRGYSPAKDYKQAKEFNPSADKETQDKRHRLIMEDFTPGNSKSGQRLKSEIDEIKEELQKKTPFRYEDDEININDTKEYSRGQSEKSNADYKSIKMVDFDQIDQSKIESKEENNTERASTMKLLLALYGSEMASKLTQKEAEELRESARETSVVLNDKK